MFSTNTSYQIDSDEAFDDVTLSSEVSYISNSSFFIARISFVADDVIDKPEMVLIDNIERILELSLDADYLVHEVQIVTLPHTNQSNRIKMDIVWKIYSAKEPRDEHKEAVYIVELNDAEHYVLSSHGTPRKYLREVTQLFQFKVDQFDEEDNTYQQDHYAKMQDKIKKALKDM